MIRKLAFLAVVLASVLSADFAAAGQLPSRIKDVKAGDWIFYRENDELIKETATGTEKVEGDYLVLYTREKYSNDGKVVGTEEVARLQSGEEAELAEYAKNKVERKRINIAGKNLNVYVISHGGDAPYETWYSDEIGITGAVGMAYSLPTGEDGKMETVKPIETLGYGNEKTKFDFKRLVK